MWQIKNNGWNGYVISKDSKQNSKTPTVAILLGFFFISDYKELYKECSKNLSLKYITQDVHKTSMVIVVKPS